MSEVDRLSNSGLYPALPIADKRGRKDGSPGQDRPGPPRAEVYESKDPKEPRVPSEPRPPKSRIDEYA
ncbi:MAG TPA: hypothetical protein VK437_17245 [Steroidobacteraceae bacterium]|nr:hypothetical protein [Steroidobacteraceae bacterium]